MNVQKIVEYEWKSDGTNVVTAFNKIRDAEIYEQASPYRFHISGDINETDIDELIALINNGGYYVFDKIGGNNHGTTKLILNKIYSIDFFRKIKALVEQRLVIEYSCLIPLDYFYEVDSLGLNVKIRLFVDEINDELKKYLIEADKKQLTVFVHVPPEDNDKLSDYIVSNDLQKFIGNMHKKYYYESFVTYMERLYHETGIIKQILDKSVGELTYRQYAAKVFQPYFIRSKKYMTSSKEQTDHDIPEQNYF